MVGNVAVYKKNVEGAWLDYIQSGADARSRVRSSIVNSWDRCRDMKVDPWQKAPKRQLQRAAFRRLLEEKQEFIHLCTPYMENLYSYVQDSDFVVGLTDETGVILKVVGDKFIQKQMGMAGFRESVDWSEWSAGTTAIGTVLILERPMQVCSAEHYCRDFQMFTSTGVPIQDANSKVIGTICLAGHDFSVQSHTLGMASATAAAIRSNLKMLGAQQEAKLISARSAAMIDCMRQIVLSVDSQGQITMANHAAIQSLHLPPHEVCIGSRLMEVLPQENPELQDIVLRRKKVTDNEITIHTRYGDEIYSLTSQIIDAEEGGVGSMVMVMDIIKKIRKPAHRISGTGTPKNFDNLVGTSPKYLEVVAIAKNAALTDSNVLILGESGTGKDVFAQAIHNHSMRKRGPFVAINCSAIPRELIGSELFGYMEGAFTGARKGGSPGKFEFADSGTIFLDEIGDMPLDLQGHLLRVIEDRTILRIGGHDAIPVDVRIIAATNHDLQDDVKRKLFRQDLFYRLNVITLHMVPLRDRLDDLDDMIRVFYKKLSNNPNLTSIPVAPSYIQALQNYDFPGNIRELQNIVERSITMFPNRVLDASCLPYEELFSQKTPSAPPPEEHRELPAAQIAYSTDKDNVYSLLVKNGGNVSKTAEEMGVARTTLYRKMDRYGFTKTIVR